MSPFLFNLVADVLSRQGSEFDQGVASRKEQGWSDTHLAISFLEPATENIRWLSKIIQFLCSMSGLRVDMEKSSLLGINLDHQKVKDFADSICNTLLIA